jgi:hypothetical protein
MPPRNQSLQAHEVFASGRRRWRRDAAVRRRRNVIRGRGRRLIATNRALAAIRRSMLVTAWALATASVTARDVTALAVTGRWASGCVVGHVTARVTGRSAAATERSAGSPQTAETPAASAAARGQVDRRGALLAPIRGVIDVAHGERQRKQHHHRHGSSSVGWSCVGRGRLSPFKRRQPDGSWGRREATFGPEEAKSELLSVRSFVAAVRSATLFP